MDDRGPVQPARNASPGARFVWPLVPGWLSGFGRGAKWGSSGQAGGTSDWFAINEDLWGTVAGSRPPLSYFFNGSIDSGRVGATLIKTLLEHSEPQPLGFFNMDLVHGYRTRRPAMVFDRDHWASLEEPVLNLYPARNAEGMPYLVMCSPEPDHCW